jgi:peptide/nickel transport system substrate-binding protein
MSRRDALRLAIAVGLSTPVASLILAACGGGDSDTPTTSSAATSAPAASAPAASASAQTGATTTASTPVATAGSTAAGSTSTTAASGPQELVIAQGLDPESLDPHQTTVSASENVSVLMVERVLKYDYDQAAFVGVLAEKWDQVDDTTLEITFHKDVTFSNGEPMNADAVKFSLERLMAAVHLTGQQLKKVGLTVEKIDDYTVRLKTPNPYPFLQGDLLRVSIVPPGYIKQVGDEAFGLKPVGTGPYVFKEWVKGDHVTVTRNDKYWNKPPALTTVTYRAIPEASSRTAALQTGEADIITDVSIPDIKTIKDASDLDIASVDSTRSIYIRWDCSDPRLSDVRVRQAFNYAVNKQLIVDTLLDGYGTVLDGQPMSKDIHGYNPDLKPYEYDPDRAKKLLDEAGFDYSKPLTLYTPEGRYVADKDTADAVVGMMHDIGVTFDLQPLEFGVWIQKHNDRTLTPMTLIGIQTISPDAFSLLNYLHTGTIGGFFFNKDYDQLVDEASITVDPDKRVDLYHQATKILRDQAGILFLHQMKVISGVNKKVQGWKPRPDEFIFVDGVSVKNS